MHLAIAAQQRDELVLVEHAAVGTLALEGDHPRQRPPCCRLREPCPAQQNDSILAMLPAAVQLQRYAQQHRVPYRWCFAGFHSGKDAVLPGHAAVT